MLPGHFEIVYSGQVHKETYRDIISQVNMVTPELVELALYISWFPRFEHTGIFTADLTLDLPKDYVAVTNGLPVSDRVSDTRRVFRWEFSEPVFDISLCAAPGLKKTVTTTGEVTVELYYTQLPEDYAADMASGLIRSMSVLSDMLGPPPETVMRVVYSPRPGWGYVRLPYIVVSEHSAEHHRTEHYGLARDFRYITHEIAHYWWHWADTGTSDDWINEGLAEYSAYLVSEQLTGTDFASQLLSEYEARSAGSVTDTAIAQTANDSPDRELNRYVKPVLLFEDLRHRYGEASLRAFLRALYRKFAETGTATTAMFLDVAGQQLDADAAMYCREVLYRTGQGVSRATQTVLSVADTALLGTWGGVLHQDGMDLRVVVHITETDGVVTAIMDSPDQDVAGIEVPEFAATADSLYFGLPAFSIVYAGTMDRTQKTVRGVWIQSGTPFTLDFVRLSDPRELKR